MEERIKNSEIKSYKIIFPEHLNNNNILFGGIAMKWMDEIAYITAMKFTRMKMVTVSVKNINFILPIKSDSIIEVVGKIILVKNVKIEIIVEIYVEDIYLQNRYKAVESYFIFAAVDKDNNPILINNEN